jgi:hypothetical protein
MTDQKWEDIPEDQRDQIIRGVKKDLADIAKKISMVPFSEIAPKVPGAIGQIFSQVGSFGDELQKNLTLLETNPDMKPFPARKEGYYEALWRDEAEAGRVIRKQRDEARERAEMAESRLATAEAAKLGKITIGQLIARGRASGLHMAVKVMADRSTLLRGSTKNRVSGELDMLARDVDALAEIEKVKSE